MGDVGRRFSNTVGLKSSGELLGKFWMINMQFFIFRVFFSPAECILIFFPHPNSCDK